MATTKKQNPLMVHGVRTCPRCLVGPGREKGGKHYGHDREVDNCVLKGTNFRGGAARKQLQQAAESSARMDHHPHPLPHQGYGSEDQGEEAQHGRPNQRPENPRNRTPSKHFEYLKNDDRDLLPYYQD